VKAYYYKVLLEKREQVQEEYCRLTQEHLKDVKAKKHYGVASTFNVLRAEVELSNAEAQLLQTKQSNHLAKHHLLKTIGVSMKSDILLIDDLVYRYFEVSESETVEAALSGRPDLSSAELNVKLQTEAAKIAHSNYYPDLDAFFNYGWSKPDSINPSIDEWEYYWQAGLSFKLNLFGMNREGQIMQENARLRQQEIGYLDTREQAVYEVRSALSALTDSDELVNTQKLTVAHANEGLRLAEVGYREGTLDQVSVLEARNALNDAKLLHWTSLYNHTMAVLLIKKATGKLAPHSREWHSEILSTLENNSGKSNDVDF